jgi:hypothetical protein
MVFRDLLDPLARHVVGALSTTLTTIVPYAVHDGRHEP